MFDEKNIDRHYIKAALEWNILIQHCTNNNNKCVLMGLLKKIILKYEIIFCHWN